MPTAKEMDDKYSAEMQLFGGSPAQHEDRLREDPAYLAANTTRPLTKPKQSTVASLKHRGVLTRYCGVEGYFYFDGRREVMILKERT